VKPTADSPLQKLGIEKVPPIITSAVLLDAKSHLGRGSAMQPGQVVTAADIEAMLKAQGLENRGLIPGDVLYIYTGWGDNWKDPDTEKFYYSKGPGLAYDAARYIAEKKVVLLALDNPFTDPVAEGFLQGKAPPPAGAPEGLPFAIHHTNLAETGIYHPERQSRIARSGQGVAVMHHHPAVASAGKCRLAGTPGLDRRARAIARDLSRMRGASRTRDVAVVYALRAAGPPRRP